jgi:hypothetical protein
MSTRQSLPDLLQEWHRHTLAETQALQQLDWPGVFASQLAKEELQTLLGRVLESPVQLPAGPLRQQVQELIALEMHNRDWLAARKTSLQARGIELADSARNLKRVRQSYAPSALGCWHSYG